MLRFFILVLSLGLVCSQINWVSRAQVPSPSTYFSKVVQEMVYDLENMEWCNLKIDDHKKTIDEIFYNWRVKGNVTYSNGFVISIQKLDMTDIQQTVASNTVNGESVPRARVSATLSMHHVKIGFDVLVELEDPAPPYTPLQKYTTHFTYERIELKLDVTKNLLTKEMSSNPSWTDINSGGNRNRPTFMPANNVTEVLSRRSMIDLDDSLTKWCKDIIAPMLVDISMNRVEFPEICFINCPR